jgi:hypothetical protein
LIRQAAECILNGVHGHINCSIVAAGLALALVQLPATVRVRITDTTGTPITGANLMILKVREQEAVVLATTDAAGKHTFSFTPDSSRYRLDVRKVGYVQTTRLVNAAPGDTLSIELRLANLRRDTIPVSLPTVVAEGRRNRGPADTIKWLEKKGFYDRRHEGFAPSSAFASADQLDHWKPTTITNIGYFAGRRICGTNVYVDGMRAAGGIRDVQSWLTPDNVAGIETYVGLEIPVSYAGHGANCATLIWLR